MQKEKVYERTRFSPEVLKEAADELFRGVDPKDDKVSGLLSVETEDGKWNHDTEEEFFADYRLSSGGGVFNRDLKGHSMWVQFFSTLVSVNISAPDRSSIQRVFEVFEKNYDKSRLPTPPVPEPIKPTIFIGHGRSPLWRDLKDHLQDKHGYRVEAYEIGARAGHTIRDILLDMLDKSSFATLVMTGEDETTKGDLRARQNVIHEAGLFQGRLGFNRAIILLEEGTEEFSNIHGIEQIRFSRNNIKETFGEILATLKREFNQ